VKLDPRDADSYYFEGVCYAEMKEFDKAIAIFKQALKIDPLHASSRSFNGAGAAAVGATRRTAKEHFKRFQAFDEHQDRRADWAGLRRAGTLLDGDAG
jgi:tetratricopeptide (TPR) repeat protein